MRGLAFFSGGKDSVFAVMRAKQRGIPVDCLLFNTHDFPRPSVHEINKGVVDTIARLLGIPLRTVHLEEGKEYEILESIFSELEVGVVTVGNINVKDQMEWYERICDRTGVKLHAPLWAGPGAPTLARLEEQVSSGLRAAICSLNSSLMPAQYLGRVIDEPLLYELPRLADPCGEGGEYHTLVVDAPVMSGKIVLGAFDKLEFGDYQMLKFKDYKVEAK
ncbi:MAG: diphthine--ammonia ligase [Candidatus Verstraetearchaeota archaeon]|nr:diphthine--ammonia ligase [Candidatus Verstraetearchaeota archaeon]